MLTTVTRAQQAPALANLDTTLLANLLTAASNLIEKYCQREFAYATYTDVQSGEGVNFLYLPNTPISTVTSVVITEVDQSTETILTNDLTVNTSSGKINIAPWATTGYGVFQRGHENITTTYTGGYATIPQEVQESTIQIASSLYGGTAQTSGIKSEKMGDYSYTKDDAMGMQVFTPLVMGLLEPYRNFEF